MCIPLLYDFRSCTEFVIFLSRRVARLSRHSYPQCVCTLLHTHEPHPTFCHTSWNFVVNKHASITRYTKVSVSRVIQFMYDSDSPAPDGSRSVVECIITSPRSNHDNTAKCLCRDFTPSCTWGMCFTIASMSALTEWLPRDERLHDANWNEIKSGSYHSTNVLTQCGPYYNVC